MKIRLLLIGKTDDGWVSEGCDQFARRIIHYLPFTLEVIPDLKLSGKVPPSMLRKKEAEKVLERLGPDDRLVLLDEQGKEASSVEFAGLITKEDLSGTRNLVFLIAGAFGADDILRSRAHHILSLSQMTFPHQLVRVMFLEQLYRACTINKGEKYHNA